MAEWPDIAIGAAIAVAIVAIYHLAFAGPRLAALNATFTSPANEATPAFVKRTEDRLAELEKSVSAYALRVGFVRFSSFEHAGPELSYALALLNAQGDGVVMTSIYSREEARTFGKRIRGYAAEQDLSKEEQDAIAQARAGVAA
jgi:hypothetical protein